MSRDTYASALYAKAKASLPEPDGKHCIICGKELGKYKRKYCDEECFLNWYDALNIPSWTKIRDQVFERDNYTCKLCGKHFNKGETDGWTSALECDHIIPVVRVFNIFHTKQNIPIEDIYGRYVYGEENLRTLCKDCHRVVTNSLMRKLHKNFSTRIVYRDEHIQFLKTQKIARWFKFIENPILIPPLESFILNV